MQEEFSHVGWPTGRESGPVSGRELKPGERIVGGRIQYSAAWLSTPPTIKPTPKEDTVTIYEVRTRFNVEPEEGDDLGPEFIASLVAHALRQAVAADPALKPTEGLTIHVRPRGAKLHVEAEVPA